MTLEEAIAKAQKLLNLAESDNPNEAATAAAQAQKILDRYEISKAMMEEKGEEEPDNEEIAIFESSPLDSATKFNLDKWRTRLADRIAKSNMCEIYMQTNNHHNKKYIMPPSRRRSKEENGELRYK